MEGDSFDLLSGTVEVDEAYIGGKWENKPLKVRRKAGVSGRADHYKSKTAVFGMVQCGGRARAWKVPNTTQNTLLPKMCESIHHDATVFTDAAPLYKHVNEFFLKLTRR